MKTLLNIFIPLLIVVMVHANVDADSAILSPSELKVVDAYIKSKERIVSNTDVSLNRTENRDVRRYIQGDINRDGIPDVIVLYGLEGEGNNWNIYMAVFKRPSMKCIGDARIGGKGYRNAELSKVSDGTIEVKIDFYSLYDAMCCPSVKGTSYYSVEKGVLTEERVVVDCTGWKPPERPN